MTGSKASKGAHPARMRLDLVAGRGSGAVEGKGKGGREKKIRFNGVCRRGITCVGYWCHRQAAGILDCFRSSLQHVS